MKLLIKLQNIFGTTKQELTIISILLLGLITGAVYRFTMDNRADEILNYNDVYYVMDSLASVEKTSYVGTDIKNNSFEDLTKSDTLIKKQTLYPEINKKGLPKSKININIASKVELTKIPGIGEKTAIKILEYRENNKFSRIEDIQNIKGIGPKKFEKMKDYLSI